MFLVGGLGLLMALGAWWGFSAPRPRGGRVETAAELAAHGSGDYVGVASCRACHPGECASYGPSGHARTLRPAGERSIADWLDGRTVPDPDRPGVAWSYRLQDGRLSAERQGVARPARFPLDWAFGSGQHATTFVTLKDRDPKSPELLEHRLTYFAHLKEMGVTPGQEARERHPDAGPDGRRLAGKKAVHCFGCHTTATSAAGPERLEPATMLPNITCERCHGPGRAHVEAARSGSTDLALPFGPGRWDAEEQMRLCGQCHRHPAQAPPGRLRADNPEIVRFQPVGLMQSACYTRSRGALSCVNCHDPHAGASAIASVYEAACLDCHRGKPQVVCSVSPRSGCVDCHMPKRDAGQGVLFTDHWIRRPRPDARPAGETARR